MSNKVIFHYLIYSVLFIVIHFVSISVVSFFHFLLDHELSIIEYWLTRNGWEVLIFSKVLASVIFISFFVLNSLKISLKEVISSLSYRPTWDAVAIILYFGISMISCFYFISGFSYGSNEEDFLYTSYLGSILYYMTDYFVVLLIFKSRNYTDKMRVIFSLYLALIFFTSTKIALPYTSQFYLFIFLHFLTILTFYSKNPNNFMNPLLYCLVIIGPLSSYFGVDLVWDNAYSPYQFDRSSITVSIMCVWIFGLIYHYRRKT